MTMPDDKNSGSPRERFRNILSADRDEVRPPENHKPPVVNLPKVGSPAPETGQHPNPNEGRGNTAAAAFTAPRSASMFWTIGAILSVIANIILIAELSGGRGQTPSPAMDARALSGIYLGLDQLDQAHLKATVPIESSVPLNATVAVKSSTRITLARDVLVRGAHVTLNAAGVSIDAPAEVTLPAGTVLDVNLDMALPMETNLPLAMEFPLDIRVRDTEIHAAIQTLMDSLRPLVCAATPAASLSDGTPICK